MSQSKKMEGAFQGEAETVVRERLGEGGLSSRAGEAQGQMRRRWIEVNRTQEMPKCAAQRCSQMQTSWEMTQIKKAPYPYPQPYSTPAADIMDSIPLFLNLI